MPPPDIAFEAKRVDSLFQQLTEAIHQSDLHNETSHGISKSEASDTFGRYRIWAGNIGAFQHIESKSSLAYRIRDAPKIAAQIADLLDDVAESLDDGKRPCFVVIMFLTVMFSVPDSIECPRESYSAFTWECRISRTYRTR